MIRRKTKPQNPRRDKRRNKTKVVYNTKGGGGGGGEKRRKEKKVETLRTGFKIWHFY